MLSQDVAERNESVVSSSIDEFVAGTRDDRSCDFVPTEKKPFNVKSATKAFVIAATIAAGAIYGLLRVESMVIDRHNEAQFTQPTLMSPANVGH